MISKHPFTNITEPNLTLIPRPLGLNSLTMQDTCPITLQRPTYDVTLTLQSPGRSHPPRGFAMDLETKKETPISAVP
jgi:hypothetical protein